MIESNYLEMLKQYMIDRHMVGFYDNVVSYILAHKECMGDGFDRIIAAAILADETIDK